MPRSAHYRQESPSCFGPSSGIKRVLKSAARQNPRKAIGGAAIKRTKFAGNHDGASLQGHRRYEADYAKSRARIKAWIHASGRNRCRIDNQANGRARHRTKGVARDECVAPDLAV